MQGTFYTISLLIILFSLIVLAGGVLVWLAPVPAEQTTPAQDNLRELADTVIKGSFGAIIGFNGSLLYRQRNGGASDS